MLVFISYTKQAHVCVANKLIANWFIRNSCVRCVRIKCELNRFFYCLNYILSQYLVNYQLKWNMVLYLWFVSNQTSRTLIILRFRLFYGCKHTSKSTFIEFIWYNGTAINQIRHFSVKNCKHSANVASFTKQRMECFIVIAVICFGGSFIGAFLLGQRA